VHALIQQHRQHRQHNCVFITNGTRRKNDLRHLILVSFSFFVNMNSDATHTQPNVSQYTFVCILRMLFWYAICIIGTLVCTNYAMLSLQGLYLIPSMAVGQMHNECGHLLFFLCSKCNQQSITNAFVDNLKILRMVSDRQTDLYFFTFIIACADTWFANNGMFHWTLTILMTTYFYIHSKHQSPGADLAYITFGMYICYSFPYPMLWSTTVFVFAHIYSLLLLHNNWYHTNTSLYVWYILYAICNLAFMTYTAHHILQETLSNVYTNIYTDTHSQSQYNLLTKSQKTFAYNLRFFFKYR